MRIKWKPACAVAVLITLAGAQVPSPQAHTTSVLDYIQETWTTLVRSSQQLAKAAVDPKFKPGGDGRWPVYISQSDDVQLVEESLRREMPAAGFKTIQLTPLPENLDTLKTQGLLYLPHPYIVPGGRFNEMYGWDSYFIEVGLNRDGKDELAKNMADNFLYEVKHYGRVLNANRSYYLSRSQPPFLSQMVLIVYRRNHDKHYLEEALPLIEKNYDLWAQEPHLTKGTQLARYYDMGDGPAPEVLSAEKDAQGRTHYDLVKDYFKTHTITDYDVSQYYDRPTDQLKQLFYKGDRSMRESGFDPSNRFGPFNIDIIHYNPVCLNSLLYLQETQIAEIHEILGHPPAARSWKEKAAVRGERINRLLWDQKDGLYYDYDFVHQKRRPYPFLTTFYPLWAGFATKEQAARIQKNLNVFERTSGLQTSAHVSGNQWDSPFGWAPLQWIAIEGLRQYGYQEDAERLSMKFLSLVNRDFRQHGYLVEKYDVVHGSSNVSSQIHYGYSANQAGFGWTNAVFTALYDKLTPENQRKLLATR